MAFRYLETVLAEVEELASLFGARDRTLYLVGGIVRDLWLDLPVGNGIDIDLTTDARPEEIRAIVGEWADALWLQGERFGTIGLHRGDRSMEITTHRGEVYTPDSRKPVVVFGDDVETDLSRRDFTVNAMAVQLGDHGAESGLVDPFGGVEDLRAGVLRTPLDPEVSFNDDPLRVLRAARFMARFGLDPDPGLAEAAQSLVHRLDIVAVERVRDELEKLLSGPDCGVGLDFLERTGALTRLIPVLAEGDRVGSGIALASMLPTPWWLRLVGLLWPGSDSGADVRARARDLRCSTEVSRFIETVADAALSAQNTAVPAEPGLKRWIAACGDVVEEAMALTLVTGSAAFSESARALVDSGEAVDPPLPVDGSALIASFDLAPGPEVGRLLHALRDAQFEEGPLTRERALALAATLLDS